MGISENNAIAIMEGRPLTQITLEDKNQYLEEVHKSVREMANEMRTDFCINCRRKTEYELVPVVHKRSIKGKEYKYETFIAQCIECGEEMSIPGLMDEDNKRFDAAYRSANDLVSIDNIKTLMKLYNLGKAPVSTALGFGEITITRYLAGQMPSKDYSDIIKHALTDPEFMKDRIDQNKDKLGMPAYKKASKAISALSKGINGISKKMKCAIAYIIRQTEEITPLALQKLLYYSQGINMALNGVALFKDDCEAWAHGPVYPNVYHLFKEFKYNPIDDSRYVMFDLAKDDLSAEEKKVLSLVIESFGMYSGKVLEKITHDEGPWKDARSGLGPYDSSNRIILKEDLEAYFSKVNEEYDLGSERGLNKYINSKRKNN